MLCARRRLLRYDLVNCGVGGFRDRSTSLPGRFLAQEEVRITNPKANLMTRFTNVPIAEGLQGR